MTPDELVEQAALEAIAGRVVLYDASPGKCLRVVRELVQAALGIDYTVFYGLVTERVEENASGSPWARDAQRSLRKLGYSIPFEERTGGMLIFDAGLAIEGHVGVLVGRSLVFENTGSRRGIQISGSNRLSRLDDWRDPSKLEVMAIPWAQAKVFS